MVGGYRARYVLVDPDLFDSLEIELNFTDLIDSFNFETTIKKCIILSSRSPRGIQLPICSPQVQGLDDLEEKN
jgi:hypothetical protein